MRKGKEKKEKNVQTEKKECIIPLTEDDEKKKKEKEEWEEVTMKRARTGVVGLIHCFTQLMRLSLFFQSFYSHRDQYIPLLQSNYKIVRIAAIECFSQSFYYSIERKDLTWNNEAKKEIFLSIIMNNCHPDPEIRSCC